MKLKTGTLTVILILTIAVLISTSFVITSYSRANEEHACDISEESEDDSHECGEEHNMTDEMDEHHESMHMNHHEELGHGCH